METEEVLLNLDIITTHKITLNNEETIYQQNIQRMHAFIQITCRKLSTNMTSQLKNVCIWFYEMNSNTLHRSVLYEYSCTEYLS
jgi:hypothetical protein